MKRIWECCQNAETRAPAYKLEALDSWLSDRVEASVSVGVVSERRRCTIQAHGKTFEAETRAADEPGGGWRATWFAIVEACTLCERFEAEAGADVG